MTMWSKFAVIGTTSAMLFAGAMTLKAEDKPADAGSASAEAKSSKKSPKLTQPWSKISSLSDEQKEKIADIHKSTLAEKKKLDAKEHDDVMATLNDDQKAEVEKIEGDKKVASKTKSEKTE